MPSLRTLAALTPSEELGMPLLDIEVQDQPRASAVNRWLLEKPIEESWSAVARFLESEDEDEGEGKPKDRKLTSSLTSSTTFRATLFVHLREVLRLVPNEDDVHVSRNVRADSSQITLDPHGRHLGCFAGGMLALGGRVFNYPEHVSGGRKIIDASGPTLLLRWVSCPRPSTWFLANQQTICQSDNRKWEDAVVKKNDAKDDVEALKIQHRLVPGFTHVGDRRYIHRPDAIESVFILYRITGNRAFQDAAWKMWTTFSNLTETEFANAAMDDVTVPWQPQLSERMESFWMAEMLKYFYLIFIEPELISLDDYILKTEAHTFKRPK